MQHSDSCDRRLWFQCLFRRADGQFTGNVPVCYAGDYAAVIKIQDRTIIPRLMVFQKQICEICTPSLIWLFRSKILTTAIVLFPAAGIPVTNIQYISHNSFKLTVSIATSSSVFHSSFSKFHTSRIVNGGFRVLTCLYLIMLVYFGICKRFIAVCI